jgi:hypothetical protein
VRAFSFGNDETMPGQSFADANAFHRMMRIFAATKVPALAQTRPSLPEDFLTCADPGRRDAPAARLTGGRERPSRRVEGDSRRRLSHVARRRKQQRGQG